MLRLPKIANLCLLGIFTLASGCQSRSQHTYPEDPLFLARKPIETPAAAAPAPVQVVVEPTAPPVPPLVLAAARQRLERYQYQEATRSARPDY